MVKSTSKKLVREMVGGNPTNITQQEALQLAAQAFDRQGANLARQT